MTATESAPASIPATPPPREPEPCTTLCAEHCGVPSVAEHLADLLAELSHLGGVDRALVELPGPTTRRATDTDQTPHCALSAPVTEALAEHMGSYTGPGTSALVFAILTGAGA